MKGLTDMFAVKKGDILLFKSTNGLISKSISWAIDSPYTHVALAISNKTIIDTNFFKVVAIRNLNYRRDFVILRVKHATEKQLDHIITLAKKKIGSPYDYLRIFGMFCRYILQIDISHMLSLKERFICTEVIDHPFYNVGIELFPNRDVGDISPADFFESDAVEMVGENAKCDEHTFETNK